MVTRLAPHYDNRSVERIISELLENAMDEICESRVEYLAGMDSPSIADHGGAPSFEIYIDLNHPTICDTQPNEESLEVLTCYVTPEVSTEVASADKKNE